MFMSSIHGLFCVGSHCWCVWQNIHEYMPCCMHFCAYIMPGTNLALKMRRAKSQHPQYCVCSAVRDIDTHNADAIVGHLPAESTLIHRSQAPVAHNIEPLLNDGHRRFRPLGAQYTAAPELVSRPLARAIVEVIAVPACRPSHESETTTRVNKYMQYN